MPYDFSLVAGFDTMSDADKVTALTNLLNSSTDESAKWKAQFDKASSEVAGYKKQLKANNEAQSSSLGAKDDEIKTLTETVNQLKRENALSKLSNGYIKQGYEESLARETAEAMLDGNMEKVLENNVKFNALQKNAWEAAMLKGTPKPPAGSPTPAPVDYKKLAVEAQNAGDFSAAAYYTRLAQEASD